MNNEPFDLTHVSDGYEINTLTYDELLNEVKEMEDKSKWTPDVESKDIVVHPIPSMIEIPEVEAKSGIPSEILIDTLHGAEVYVTTPDGKNKCLRNMGRITLCDRANIAGSALSRECPADFAATVNMALNVAKGKCIVLTRYGKIAAFHSDGAGGYRVMPISELLQIADHELRQQFGTPVFLEGYNSHDFTKCVWALPDVRDKIVDEYLSLLPKKVRDRWDDTKLMPAVRLTSSDTATAAATLVPIFRTDKRHSLRLSDGIKVKHIRATGENVKDGVERFEERVKTELWARFKDTAEDIARLSNLNIWHPENVVIGICNKFRIARKYGENAREEMERFMQTENCVSAYDVFLALSEALGFAQECGLSETVVFGLEEKLFSTLNPAFDWQGMDVGGTVAWGSTTA